MKSVVLMIGLVVAALSAPALQAREYLKSERAQQRGFTPGVVTDGGKVVWVSGQTGLVDEQGKSMAGDFEGQARVIFRAIDGVVKRAGGGLKDVVTITVYLTDPRLLTRAVLGLYNSIWHWYRPNGLLALDRIGEYYTERALAVVGLPPEALAPGRAAA